MSKLVLLGKGTYGAVIRPTLTMEDSFNIPNVKKVPYTNKESDDIAKVFLVSRVNTQESYIKEIEELTKIQKIDPTHSFTVPFKGADYGMNPIVDISFNIKSEPKNILEETLSKLVGGNKKLYKPVNNYNKLLKNLKLKKSNIINFKRKINNSYDYNKWINNLYMIKKSFINK
jgi:hypothetical protein